MVSWGHSCGILGAVAALIPGAAWAGSADGQQPAAPKKELTLEDRGDIFMARKMFREAIETYLKTEPLTAVVLNKTGIAYQQQNELELAKKFYGRATKTDPNYAEAINNQGPEELQPGHPPIQAGVAAAAAFGLDSFQPWHGLVCAPQLQAGVRDLSAGSGD
jgi:tetratricopeptide (TPR) repeat protein